MILRYGRKFENTVEVGSAELKGGKLLDRMFLLNRLYSTFITICYVDNQMFHLIFKMWESYPREELEAQTHPTEQTERRDTGIS